MIRKREKVQAKTFQDFKVCTSKYKESDKIKQQEIDLYFQQQEQQEKEALQHKMEEELQLEYEIRVQEEVDKKIVAGGSGADIDANYVNENVDYAIEENQRQKK